MKVPIIGSNVTANDIVSGGSHLKQAFSPVCPTIPARKARMTNHPNKSDLTQPVGEVFSPKTIDIGINKTAPINVTGNA